MVSRLLYALAVAACVCQARDLSTHQATALREEETLLARPSLEETTARGQLRGQERRRLATVDEPPKSPFKLIPYKERQKIAKFSAGTTTAVANKKIPTTVVPKKPSSVVVATKVRIPVAIQEAKQEERKGFDFIVAGFPKCGTTSLLKAFGVHEEADMAPSENCAIASPGQADHIVRRKLDETLMGMSQDPNVKRAFKCPTAMYNYKTLVRMQEHSPDVKFVVGMRHPVKMLQSFYNYRVTEIYERQTQEEIPHLLDVVASGTPWKGVSLESTRFDLFLMQMGKTSLTSLQMQELVGRQYELAIKPTTFTVFLYTVDQLEDTDPLRSENLRNEMQRYLGLSKPIQPFGHENKNHQVGDAGHKESIDICDARFADIRRILTEQGQVTAAWLRDHFIHSPDVVVANREHFLQTLEDWGVDPCTVASA